MESRIMSKTRILLLIAAFLVITFGSFVYYVATWDQRKAQLPATTNALPTQLSIAT